MIREELDHYDLPDSPGVYIFRDKRKDILYIGKATSLRDRVRSYFASDLAESRSPAIAQMVRDAVSVSWQETDSVLEALILEANLIKREQPPFNTLDKDNKSFNYLVVTKEKYPRVLIVRGRELFQKWRDADIKKLFGPFPAGGALKEGLKIVRRIFPFRDNSCTPESGKPCFNAQIGLCPGVCSGATGAQEYAVTIKHICELFGGNFKGLKRQLGRDMKVAAADQRYEQAAVLRRQVEALSHIRDVSLIKEERVSSGGGVRIEGYDVAHTGGDETVGVMTVVQNGEALKSEYRKFKINSVTNNDVAALKEVLSRRFEHPEWQYPRLIVVDGSTAQMRAAQKVLAGMGIQIPIVGVVKNEAHKAERLIGDARAREAYEKDIVLVNAEAHRFAIGWHRRRRSKAFIA
jgi:excinuclease ABC subunit C